MPTHTPGPWKVYGPRPGFVDIQVESTVPEKWTATKKHSAFNQGICGLDAFVVRARPEEALANARLIAAAPELLEALEATRAELYRLAMKAPDLNPTVDPILDAARAAIAKAKGEK